MAHWINSTEWRTAKVIAYKPKGPKAVLTPLSAERVVIDGTPTESSTRIVDAAGGGPIRSGVYEVTKGSFKIEMKFHEFATVLSGEVELIDESGNAVTYGPGDSWFCEKGEWIIWNIKTDRLRKCFFAVDPDHIRRDAGVLARLVYKDPQSRDAISVIS